MQCSFWAGAVSCEFPNMKHFIQHIHNEVWHKNLFDYLLITLFAVFFLLGMRLFSGQREAQFFCIVAFTVGYIAWGVYHHILTRTLRIRILVEYILIGFAVLFFSLTLTFP